MTKLSRGAIALAVFVLGLLIIGCGGRVIGHSTTANTITGGLSAGTITGSTGTTAATSTGGTSSTTGSTTATTSGTTGSANLLAFVNDGLGPDVHTVDLDTGFSRRVTTTGISRAEVAPVVSPDGSKIAYRVGASEIWLVNSDGTNDHQIYAQSDGLLGRMAFDPTGTLIAFVGQADAGDADGGLYVLDIASQNKTELVVTGMGKIMGDISWHPTGSEVLVTTDLAASNNSIYRVSMTTGIATFVTNGNYPRYSTNGNRIIACQILGGTVFTCDLNGQNATSTSIVGTSPICADTFSDDFLYVSPLLGQPTSLKIWRSVGLVGQGQPISGQPPGNNQFAHISARP